MGETDEAPATPKQPELALRKPGEHILQFFRYDHLPAHLAAVSKPFCDLAHAIVYGAELTDPFPHQALDALPRNPERTVALRKLLEAKDAAVRALLAKE